MYSILPQIRPTESAAKRGSALPIHLHPYPWAPGTAATGCCGQLLGAARWSRVLGPLRSSDRGRFFFEKPMVLAGHRLRTTTSWGTFFATDHGAGHAGGDLGSEVQCSGAKLRGHSTAREVPGCSQHPNTSPNTFGAKLVDKEVQLVTFSTLQLSFTYNGLERPCNMRQCRNHDLGVPGWGVSYGKLGARFYSVITWSFHV